MKKSNFFNISTQLELPFLETNRNLIYSIFNTLKNKFGLEEHSNQRLIDLGAGNGRIIIHSALNYDIESVGIEINSDLINEAKEFIKSLRKENIHQKKLFKKIKFIHGDLYKVDLRDFDFIYIYSFPPMQKYLRHVFMTAKKGSILISYKYPLDGFENLLKFNYELMNETKDQIVSTFFYKLIL
jgi:SAM-dependent methyltransferase